MRISSYTALRYRINQPLSLKPLTYLSFSLRWASRRTSPEVLEVEEDTNTIGGAEDSTSSIDRDLSNIPVDRKKKCIDNVFESVLTEAMNMKAKGGEPDMDYIYLMTQERIYESDHGHKPISRYADDTHRKYLPYPPDLTMHRLEPLPMDDPWPTRAITLNNPVLSSFEANRDKELSATGMEREKDGNTVGDAEDKLCDDKRRMYAPRSGIDPIDEFTDSIDEHYYWEEKIIDFVREVPLWQRKSLPYLHEHYRILAHRMVRAENRYIHCRDAALIQMKGGAPLYAKTEERLSRSSRLLTEIHKSLSSPSYNTASYNTAQIKKMSLLGLIISMSDEEYAEWLSNERIKKNNLMAEFSS